MRDLFPLNKKISMDYNQELVSDTGIEAVKEYLRKDYTMYNASRYLGEAVAKISTEWLVEEGEYQGTFPKRLAAYLKRESAYYVPSNFIKNVGDITRQHVVKKGTYTVDFVSNLEWKVGEFGDYGSCFWDDRQGARVMLEEHKSLAMRFYLPNNKGARCWVVFPEKTDSMYYGAEVTKHYEVAVIFNAYGMKLSTMGHILSDYLEMGYTEIKLKNNGDTDGRLYINGTGHGYLIGKGAQLNVTKVDLKWKVREDWSKCHICGKERSIPSDIKLSVGRTICIDCKEKTPLSKCEGCYCEYLTSEKVDVNKSDGSIAGFCAYCARTRAAKRDGKYYIS